MSLSLTKSLAVLSAAVALTGLSMVAHAAPAILYSTDFNSPTYSNGGLIGQDSWVITGSSVVSPVSVANTATDGNVTLAATGQDVNRPFTPAATFGSVYLSADITIPASAGANGDYFLHLGDGGTTNFNDRIYAKNSGLGYVMALGTGAGAVTYGTTILNFGQTYHIVAEYDLLSGTVNDTAALYVNPTDPIVGGDNLYVAGTTIGADGTSFSSVNLRQGSGGPLVTVDNITVATVPEPMSLSLLGLGAVALFGRRRKA